MSTFISHSSAKAEEDQRNADSMRRELIARLEPDREVLVDEKRLLPGAEWRQELFLWMARCDSAVILIHREGLTATWLKREANNLFWRSQLGARLTLVPVLLRGVTPSDLRRSELSHLADLQCVLQGESEGCEELVDRIVKRLGDAGGAPGRTDTSGMRSLTDKIEHCLDGVNAEQPLIDIARALGNDVGEWPFVTPWEGRRFVAHQFLGPVPTGQVPGAVADIEFYLTLDRLSQFVTLILPTWIDPMDVRLLLPDGSRVVATLAAKKSRTAHQHIHRASCSSGRYWVETVLLRAGEEQEQEFMRACLAAACRLLKSENVQDAPLDGEVLFLVIDPDDTDLRTVGKLVGALIQHPDLYWLNIVVLTDDAETAELDMIGRRALRIELQPGTEDRVGRTARALEDILARRKQYGKDLAS
ncbi:TIR domain-containing protein [Streptomyces sp. NPDC102259]|uniref:TIR domain-containing protein n=1 Tax=Streptomyces sp. NPDC102259 TaxID=3366148 RepID=UPI00382F68C1